MGVGHNLFQGNTSTVTLSVAWGSDTKEVNLGHLSEETGEPPVSAANGRHLWESKTFLHLLSMKICLENLCKGTTEGRGKKPKQATIHI